MTKPNKAFVQEKEFEEIIESNNEENLLKFKQEIAKIISKEIKVKAKNDRQRDLIHSIKNNEITICSGIAGSGKTYVSLAFALSLLRKLGNRHKNIYLVKSVTTLKGEEIGFLKGELKDKIEPFMWSFYINMEKIIMESTVKQLVDKNIIRPFPLAYMRGASLDDCIIIADEMQNVSLDNARTLLTRIGSNSKLILLGDTNQIDMKNKEESSLYPLLNMFRDVENVGTVEMNDSDDNIRNPLITVIENKFKEYYSNNKTNGNNKKYNISGNTGR
jgi:phosphate starvation-inducible PhoH-like protein